MVRDAEQLGRLRRPVTHAPHVPLRIPVTNRHPQRSDQDMITAYKVKKAAPNGSCLFHILSKPACSYLIYRKPDAITLELVRLGSQRASLAYDDSSVLFRSSRRHVDGKKAHVIAMGGAIHYYSKDSERFWCK